MQRYRIRPMKPLVVEAILNDGTLGAQQEIAEALGDALIDRAQDGTLYFESCHGDATCPTGFYLARSEGHTCWLAYEGRLFAGSFESVSPVVVGDEVEWMHVQLDQEPEP